MTTLRSVAFRAAREREWRALELAVARVESSGLRRMTPEDALRLPQLHRAALSSLSVARAVSLDFDTVEYLEALIARSHAAVFASRQSAFAAFGRFYASRFPRAVRAIRTAVLASFLSIALGTAVGWAMVAREPAMFGDFVSEELASGRGPAADTATLREALFDGEGSASFASFLFAHNTRVGVYAFLAGFALGVPAMLLLFQNGLMLGAFAALYASRGLGVELWGWLLPHGVTELLAIVLAGAAGISVGTAILFPGPLMRRAAFAAAGRDGGAVVLGAAGLFAFAALFEGVFRQEVKDTTIRYLFAAVLAAAWAAYFRYAGRRASSAGAVRP